MVIELESLLKIGYHTLNIWKLLAKSERPCLVQEPENPDKVIFFLLATNAGYWLA